MQTTTNTRRLTFESGGETLVGNLSVPSEGEPAGVVIAVGPLTSVKEQAAGTYARALAERGYAGLAFDYRHFGESGGEPRQFENPEANVEDIRNAATALLDDERLRDLPVHGLGICFGAGPMVRAVAEDSRFRAFAGVAGVYTDGAKTRESMGDAYGARIERGRAAERRWRETGEAETIPAVAPDGGDVAMPLREAYEFYGTPRGQVPNYVNGYAVQSLAYSLPFDVRGAADTIEAPVLVVHSEQALAPGLAREFYAAVRSPKRDLWLRSEGQIDFYDDPKLIAPAADAVAGFFQEV
ncbi:MAG TPA: alpha/beta hydrolase [Gaiellaceae bacterium]|nr:alpha/beta hydrolase [Gaiellaceae bacterium]